MFKKLVYLAFIALVIAATGSPCPATIAPVTRVTTDNPSGTIPYNLLSITVGNYTVTADRLVVGTTTVGLTGTGATWPQMDNLDIHDAVNTGLGTTATTMLFGGKIWKDNNGDNPDFFLFESGCDAADTPAVAAILSGGQLGQSVTIPGQWVSLGYSRITNAPDGMGMAGQNIGGMSWAITDLRDSTGKPLTNSSVIEGIALTARNGADLTCFCAVLSGQILTATHPDPADRAIYTETWVTLGWTPGDTAVSHDIYVGESFDDVNSVIGGTVPVNQPTALFFIGLGMPGDPYPGGLVPGTTYYWRIDEVEANGTTRHKGSVWSFTIPSKKAHDPTPPDGAKFMPTTVTLTWTVGLGAKLHYVYFGDNLETVSNATVGTPAGAATFTPPGPLAKGKTYYWRVDEFDAAATHKGDVWSFTTLPDVPVSDPSLVGWWTLDEGEGTIAVDWSGNGKHGAFQGDPLWVDGLDGGALEFDGDDYVDTGNTQDLAKWTIACWVISPAAPANASPSGPLHREKNYQFDWNHTDAAFRGAVAMQIGATWHAAS